MRAGQRGRLELVHGVAVSMSMMRWISARSRADSCDTQSSLSLSWRNELPCATYWISSCRTEPCSPASILTIVSWLDPPPFGAVL